MSKFKSRDDAEEALKSCLYQMKEILNRDLDFKTLRDRSLITWFANFGKSVEHISTKQLLQKLQFQRQEAESFILSSLYRASFYEQDKDLEETWIA